MKAITERTFVPLVALVAAVSISGGGAWFLRGREADRDMQGAANLAAVSAKIGDVDVATKLILAKLELVAEQLAVAKQERAELRTTLASRDEVLLTWRSFVALNPTLTPPPYVR